MRLKNLETKTKSILALTTNFVVKKILLSVWTSIGVSGSLMLWLGKIQNLPLAWMFLSTLAASTFAVLLWVGLSIRYSIFSAKYKLAIEPFPPWLCERDGVQKLIPRFNLVNLAPFPVHYDASSIEWEFNGRSGDQSTTQGTVGVIGPNGSGYVTGPVFQEEYEIGEMVKVTFGMKLYYGKGDAKEHLISGKMGMLMGHDNQRGPQVALQQIGAIEYK